MTHAKAEAAGVRIRLHDIKILSFFRRNIVMTIAMAAAALTSLIVPPDTAYADYFDFKTLTCLFCVLAVVCALKNIDFFYIIAQKIVECTKSARMSVLALVCITFVGSMLIANDMALLTFLPLGYYVLHTGKAEKYMIITFILQNIAANLGGMLTPFGNPQNLYIYSKFNIPNLEFMGIMLIPFAISLLLIGALCVIFVKAEPLLLERSEKKLPLGRCSLYLCLFALAIAIVFKEIPYLIGLAVIPAVLIFADKKALKAVDYPLLLTFVFFFIFAGNMARIGVIRDLFSSLMQKSALLTSAVSCQFISNVPSAILLSQFTDNYRDLLVGVNIGGVGTLISSLASLITFREFTTRYPEQTKKYVKTFCVVNFSFLFFLLFAMLSLRALGI